MKKSVFIAAILAAGLSACDEPTPTPTPVEVDYPAEEQANIDECPRADGQPCK